MNPPPNQKWSYWLDTNGMYYRYYWNGSGYTYAGDIIAGQDQAFMGNPDYVSDIGKSDIDIDQLPGVEVVANKIKKIFSSETYDTPKKRSQAIFIVLAISAVTLGLLVYFKKIKI